MTAAAAPAAATTVAVEVADDVEITPGLHLRLRGSAETYQAIKYNFYTSHICCVCSTTIYCIFDADYIICPFCKVVDALHKQPNATTNNNSNLKQQCSNQNKFEEDPDDSTTCAENAGGVGLGFSENDLHKWQLEIRSKAGGGIGGGD